MPREESPPLVGKKAHTRTPDTCIKSQIMANTCIPIPAGKLPFMCKGNDLQKKKLAFKARTIAPTSNIEMQK